jgi:methionyl-tRNA formyltransferase
MKIFIITDNRLWFEKLYNWRSERQETIEIFCSPNGKNLFEMEIQEGMISSLDLKSDYKKVLHGFDIGFSCHCKQIFPEELVEKVKCFNFHPGLNPYNRGWFPQVFSIINGLPVGATIHQMDKEIDHGLIVAQKEVKLTEFDTSQSVYNRIMETEFNLFDKFVDKIITGKFESCLPKGEGNYNSISDFKNLCEIDLDKKTTFREAINYLRAMSFNGYDNAYYYDSAGRKVYVSININLDDL